MRWFLITFTLMFLMVSAVSLTPTHAQVSEALLGAGLGLQLYDRYEAYKDAGNDPWAALLGSSPDRHRSEPESTSGRQWTTECDYLACFEQFSRPAVPPHLVVPPPLYLDLFIAGPSVAVPPPLPSYGASPYGYGAAPRRW